MREQRPDEDRKDYMLLVAAEYINEWCPDCDIVYDGVRCDGYCIADDCKSAADSEE